MFIIFFRYSCITILLINSKTMVVPVGALGSHKRRTSSVLPQTRSCARIWILLCSSQAVMEYGEYFVKRATGD